MMRAEVARTRPAILVASTHLLAKSLRSDCRERESLPAAGSTPKALHTFGFDLSVSPFLIPTFVGCKKVVEACNEAAILVCLSVSLTLLYVVQQSVT